MATTAIFGAGVMGETLLSGLLRSGRAVGDLLITERRPERVSELVERYGVRVADNAEAADAADTIVLVVKPQDMGSLLDEIAERVRPGNVVVSLAAGITTEFLESRLPEGSSVVRVMPNTPGRGAPGRGAGAAGRPGTPPHPPTSCTTDPGRPQAGTAALVSARSSV